MLKYADEMNGLPPEWFEKVGETEDEDFANRNYECWVGYTQPAAVRRRRRAGVREAAEEAGAKLLGGQQ